MDLIYIDRLLRDNLPEFDLFLEDVTINEYPYFYFGKLGISLRNSIDDNNSAFFDRAFEIVNSLFDQNEFELDNLLVVGVLEVLTDTKEAQRVAMLRLNSRGKELFEKLFTKFNRLI